MVAIQLRGRRLQGGGLERVRFDHFVEVAELRKVLGEEPLGFGGLQELTQCRGTFGVVLCS